MTAAYVLTMVLLSPADEGLDCIVCNVRTYVYSYQYEVCAIFVHSRDVNWVRTNLWKGKNHSAERGDTLRGSCTISAVSCTEALRNPHGSFTERTV